MPIKDESSESAASSVPAPAHSKHYVSHWRTAEERADAIKAKKQRRRAAHRIALRRSPANG
jgi:hypothetical protein